MNNNPSYMAPPYPIDAFPAEIASAIYEVMEKVKAPDALIAMSFLATMSTACQGLIDVKLPFGQISPVSLNLIVKGESGERKSAVDKIVAEPIYTHDEMVAYDHKQCQVQFKSDWSFWRTVGSVLKSMIAKAIRNGDDIQELRLKLEQHTKAEPVEPKERRFIHQNATESALMHLLEGEGRSIVITTDEGEVVLKGDLMKRPGLRNKGWDGARLLVLDRVSSGSIIARQPRITINIMVQNAILDVYQQDRGAVARGSGFWARCLVGAPASTQGFRFITYLDEEWKSLPVFHTRLKELLEQYDAMMKSSEVKRQIVEFSPEAAAEWVRLFNMIEGQIQPWQYLHDVSDFASKANEIVARVAALIHFFTKQEGKITLDTLHRSVAIVNWHLHEFKRLFSPQVTTSTMWDNMIALEKFLYWNYWWVGLPFAGKNQVLRNGPNHLRSKAVFDPVLDAMVAQGWISFFKNDSTNKVMIELNPYRFNTLNYQ